MQLLLVYLVAAMTVLAGGVSAGQGIQPKIRLHYKTSRGKGVWTEGDYNTCLPIVKEGNQRLETIIYPVRTVCQHYEDAYCRHKSGYASITHTSGHSAPARNYGYGKCHMLI